MVTKFTEIAEKKERSEADDKYIRAEVNTMIINVLNSVADDPALHPRVSQFLNDVLKFVVGEIKQADSLDEVYADFIMYILEADPRCRRFYMKYGVNLEKVDKDKKNNQFATFRVKDRLSQLHKDTNPSIYLHSAINAFGAAGGFSAFLDRIKDSNKTTSFHCTKAFIRSVRHIREWLNASFATPFIKELAGVVFPLITNISDDELKALTREDLHEIVKSIETLLHLTKDPSIYESIEKLGLDIALRQLNSKLLEKRINGINDLNLFVQRVSEGHMHARGRYDNNQLHYLNAKSMIEWIASKDLVKVILGPHSHHEIMKRSPTILKFLAKHDALRGEDLDLLWQSSIGKHETLVRVVYDTIADITHELSEEHLDLLFSRIQAVDLADYREVLLDFLKAFTSSAVISRQEKPSDKFYGVSIFWRLIQDGVEVSPLVSTKAQAILVDLLSHWSFMNEKMKYIEKCMIQLREGKSVPQALGVAKALLHTLPVSGHGSVEAVITKMENVSGLLSLLIGDFEKYISSAHGIWESWSPEQKRAADEGEEKVTDSGGSLVFVGQSSHSQQIQARLDFLDYILSHSSLLLTQPHIDDLWTALVRHAVFRADKDYLLTWMRMAVINSAQSHSDFTAFSHESTEYIFKELLCNADDMDFANMSRGALVCFQSYFQQVNQRANVLELPDRSRPKSRFCVLDFDALAGMDAMWEICASAVDADVVQRARNLLIAVHVHLSDKHKKSDIYTTFVRKSMALLRGAMDQLHSGDNTATMRVDRVVKMLSHFLHFVDSVATGGGGNENYHAKDSMEVNVVIQNKKRELETRITVGIKTSNLIGALRSELAKHIEHPVHLVRFLYNKRELYPEEFDNVSIANARIQHSDRSSPIDECIIAVKMEEGDDISKPKGLFEDHVVPRYVLANETEYFDLLFELLRVGGQVGQDVWDLLSRLPTNEQLAQKITTFDFKDESQGGALNWNLIFDPQSTLKLFYSLQIIDRSNIRPLTSYSDVQRAKIEEWCGVFLNEGGFLHLYRILMELDLDTVFSASLNRQCLRLLLTIVNYFIRGRYAPHTAKVSEGKVDYKAFVERVLVILEYTSKLEVEEPNAEEEKEGEARDERANARSPTAKSCEQHLVHCSALAITAGVEKDVSLLKSVYDFKGLRTILLTGLAQNKNQGVRDSIKHNLSRLCALFAGVSESNPEVQPPRSVFLPRLLEVMSEINTESSSCSQYFGFLQMLLDTDSPSGSTEDVFDAVQLSRDIASKIKSHPILERRAMDTPDQVLIGLLNLATVLATRHPHLKELLGQSEGLIKEVFVNCLFAIPDPDSRNTTPPPKCKSKDARVAAFNFLVTVGNGCEVNTRDIVQSMIPNHFVTHSNGKNPREWDFQPKAEERSSAGFVGLKNLGCICYMNSLVQQLFMLPGLRNDLLSVDGSDGKENKDEDGSGKEVAVADGSESPSSASDDDFFYQLQWILAHLQESEKQYCNPAGFCNSFKDWDGNPTNVNIQMDTQEFLNMLFDRIDTKLKGTPYENVLKQHLGGVYSNEFICQGCPHYKDREEEFYAISLNVKNKKTIQDSLDSFVEGEMLEGDNAYLCGKCNKKVDTLKRTCIKRLPPTVVLHLKRFEFDFDTMQKQKLNDRLEFPRNINFKPFTKEGLGGVGSKQRMDAEEDGKAAEEKEEEHPDEYYEYELSGVLVHTGSADRGHYYSFIKERLTEEEQQQGKNPAWFEFNDTFVRDFDPEQLEDECFGGEEIRRRQYYSSAMSARANQVSRGGQDHMMMEKYRNAYLLFYDRVKKTNASDEKEAKEQSVEAKEEQEKKEEEIIKKAIQASREKAELPPAIFDRIWEENVTYWRDKNVFDVDYFEFLHKVVMEYIPTGDQEEDELHAEKLAPITTFAMPADGDLRHSVVELSTRFVLETLARAPKYGDFKSWIHTLSVMYSNSVPSCLWLVNELASSAKWTTDFLMQCPDITMGGLVADLFSLAIDIVIDHERDSLLPMSARIGDGSTPADAASSAVLRYGIRLVEMINVSPRYWRRFPMYWRMLDHVVQADVRLSHYFVSEKLIARLIDYYLGDRSPHPEVSDITNSNGHRPNLSDDWGRRPDFRYLLATVSTLVRSCESPGASPDAPAPTSLEGSVGPGAVSTARLSDMDEDMVSSRQFLSQAMLTATSRRTGVEISSLVAHWCYENRAGSEAVLGIISQGIEDNTADTVRPYFRVLMALACIEDSVAVERVQSLCSSLLGVMKIQNAYWKITMLCTEHLIRMAKKSERVYTFLNANSTKLEWVLEYCTKFKVPPSYHSTGQLQLYKPGRSQQNWQGERRESQGNALSAAGRIEAIESIIRGEPLEDVEASDSDEELSERVFEVGQWVDCRDTVGKWCRAMIVDTKNQHMLVHYDGWASKWDEWMEIGDPRVQIFGRYTSNIAEEDLKGDGPRPGDNLGLGRVFEG